MAARKKRKTATKRNPPNKRVSSSKASSKRKAHGRDTSKRKPTKRAKPTARNRTGKRTATKRPRDTKRAARVTRKTGSDKRKTPASSKRVRKNVERATRPKLKRNKQGGLREYQGPTFGRTKFGGYKEALKRVGEESQHAYDEAVESLREALDNDASEATIKRRRNKVRRLKK